MEGREDDGSWVALGRPSSGRQSEAAQGWELQTTGAWPLGEYRVEIAITDSEKRQVGVRIPFNLDPTGSDDPAD